MAALPSDDRTPADVDAQTLRVIVPAVLRNMGPPTPENMAVGILLVLLLALEIKNMTTPSTEAA